MTDDQNHEGTGRQPVTVKEIISQLSAALPETMSEHERRIAELEKVLSDLILDTSRAFDTHWGRIGELERKALLTQDQIRGLNYWQEQYAGAAKSATPEPSEAQAQGEPVAGPAPDKAVSIRRLEEVHLDWLDTSAERVLTATCTWKNCRYQLCVSGMTLADAVRQAVGHLEEEHS